MHLNKLARRSRTLLFREKETPSDITVRKSKMMRSDGDSIWTRFSIEREDCFRSKKMVNPRLGPSGRRGLRVFWANNGEHFRRVQVRGPLNRGRSGPHQVARAHM